MKISRRKQADRTAATRAALIDAGRQLFAEFGFAGVGTEGIVAAAKVSRGALYHHFADKTELFAAVLDHVEGEVAEELGAVVAANAGGDFVDVMTSAVEVWLDACDRPEVQRIVLLDGPSVLGWARWRELCQPHILGIAEAALTQAIEVGVVDPLPVRPLAHVLLAMADEAALYVAAATNREQAREQMVTITRRILSSLTP